MALILRGIRNRGRITGVLYMSTISDFKFDEITVDIKNAIIDMALQAAGIISGAYGVCEMCSKSVDCPKQLKAKNVGNDCLKFIPRQHV